MFALDDLARLFTLTVREDAAAGGLTVTAGAQTIVLSTQQPLASVAGRMISLPAAPVRDGRAWYVPVDFVSRALASILPVASRAAEAVPPAARGRRAPAAHRRARRSDRRGDDEGHDRPRTADAAHRHPGGEPAPGPLRGRRRSTSATSASRRPTRCSASTPGDAPSVLAIDLGPRFASFRAADQPAPTPGSARIVVDVIAQTDHAGARRAGARAAGSAPAPPDAPPLLDLPAPGGLRAIVIDAGHGGDDTGREGGAGHAREERHAERGAAAEGRARGAARRPRAAHARRRSGGGARSARGAGQQQQGRPLHQPARQRVAAAGRRRAPKSST